MINCAINPHASNLSIPGFRLLFHSLTPLPYNFSYYWTPLLLQVFGSPLPISPGPPLLASKLDPRPMYQVSLVSLAYPTPHSPSVSSLSHSASHTGPSPSASHPIPTLPLLPFNVCYSDFLEGRRIYVSYRIIIIFWTVYFLPFTPFLPWRYHDNSCTTLAPLQEFFLLFFVTLMLRCNLLVCCKSLAAIDVSAGAD